VPRKRKSIPETFLAKVLTFLFSRSSAARAVFSPLTPSLYATAKSAIQHCLQSPTVKTLVAIGLTIFINEA
jgi:hypothetical protein